MNSEKGMFSTFTYKIIVFIVRICFRICHPIIRVEGRENIPSGAAVLCANHSCLTDPIWIHGFARFDRLPRTMSKKELFENAFMRWLMKKVGGFPVDREGSDITAIKTAMQTLKQGNKLLIFPEGTRVRDGKKGEAHSGAVLIAHRMKAPIVPIYLSTKKGLFRPIHLVFGKPYVIEYGGNKPTADDLNKSAAEMLETIYGLGEQS